MKTHHSKIITPPNKEDVKTWLTERYGDDFEPTYLSSIINVYFNSLTKHKIYAKKPVIKYISENIFILDRIYRKQETLYWIKRGWDVKTSETKRVVRNKDWYLKTYGVIDGLDKYNEKRSNISSNCGHTLDKYVLRYGEEIGISKYDDYKKNCARNLEFFIKKYGEVDGLKKYKKFKKYIGKASDESLLVLTPLVEWLSNIIDNKEIYYGNIGSREYFLVSNGKTYLYDLTIKSLGLIIEFNGVKFHVNENWSIDEKLKWKHPFKNTTYLESIENDKFKKKIAKKNGFEVFSIWSNIAVEENIEICKQLILNKINENK